jgi:hypothetical protein
VSHIHTTGAAARAQLLAKFKRGPQVGKECN